MLNEFKKNYNLHLITFSLNTNAKQLTIITKRSILDVAAVLDPPLVSFYLPFRPLNKYLNWCQCQYYEAIYAFWGK